MTDEERTIAKLKGYNCLVKFKDGEELMFIVPELDEDDSEEESCWFESMEKVLNGTNDGYFPISCGAFSRDTIKYVIKI